MLDKNRSTGVDERTDKMVGLIVGHQEDDLTYQSRNYESENFLRIAKTKTSSGDEAIWNKLKRKVPTMKAEKAC